MRRELNIPTDSETDKAELFHRGFTEDDINASVHATALGPRSGISDAARLLRGIRLNVVLDRDVGRRARAGTR